MRNDISADPPGSERGSFLLGIGAYALWGILPLYFKAVETVPPADIVAHRICWSLLFVTILLMATRGGAKLRLALGAPRTMLLLVTTAVLIAVNWLVYVFAVNSGHVLEGSLGYFLNPFANILLGRFVLSERLSRGQWLAVAIAAAGIGFLAVQSSATLWISLVLCLSFSFYGFFRKIAHVDALTGLAIETMILAPLALGWLLLFGGAHGGEVLGQHARTSWLLAGTGVATTVPLLMFAAAARGLPYSTLGMLQFLAPTLQFLLAVLLFGEALTSADIVAFCAIWIALTIYVFELVRGRRAEAGAAVLKGMTC